MISNLLFVNFGSLFVMKSLEAVPLNPFSNLIWNIAMMFLLYQAYRLGLKVWEYLLGTLIVYISILFPIFIPIGVILIMVVVNRSEGKVSGFGGPYMGALKHSKNVEATYRKNLYIKNQFKVWVRGQQNPFNVKEEDRDHEFERLYTIGELEKCRRRLNEMGIEGVERDSGLHTAFSEYAKALARFDKAVMKSYKGKKVYGIEDDPQNTKIDKWVKRD